MLPPEDDTLVIANDQESGLSGTLKGDRFIGHYPLKFALLNFGFNLDIHFYIYDSVAICLVIIIFCITKEQVAN